MGRGGNDSVAVSQSRASGASLLFGARKIEKVGADIPIETFQQEIPLEAKDMIQKRVEKLNQRANKLGIDGFLKVKFGTPFAHHEKDSRGKTKWVEKRVKATVVGRMPKLDGWTFLATLDHKDGAAMVRRMPGVDDDASLEKYYHADSKNCDHCHENRKRNDTYIIKSEEKGETMQVGSACLKDFIGHVNPLEYIKLQNDLGGLLEGIAAPVQHESTSEFLAHAARVLRREGRYVSSKNSLEWEKPATRDLVSSNRRAFLTTSLAKDGTPLFVEPEDEDYELAKAAVEWIQNLPAQEANNDYMHNLKVASQEESMTPRMEGYLASLIPAYQRATQEKAEKVEKQFVGTPGDKQVFKFKVKQVREYDGYAYGQKIYKHVFEDESGNTLVWTGKYPLDEGEVYQGTFKIKAHDTHAKFGKQTVLYYPKNIEPVED